MNLLTQGEPSPSCNSHSMFYSAIILFAQHLIFIGDEYNDINEPLKPPWLSLQMSRRGWKEFPLLSARSRKGLIQLCLLAVATPCLWALGLIMPPSDFHLTIPLLAIFLLHNCSCQRWGWGEKLSWKRLKISSCKKFVRSGSEYVFHAFKGECFSTPEMLWGVRNCVWLYLCVGGVSQSIFCSPRSTN